jgi:cytochrome c peroxidase
MKKRIRRPAPPVVAAGLLLPLAAALASSAPQRPAEAPPKPPAGLPAVEWPNANPYSKEKWELGRLLYFDKRLSSDGTIACASCHQPGQAFSNGQPVATGIKGQQGTRAVPTDINRAYSKVTAKPQPGTGTDGAADPAIQPQFWDGRAPSLEEQAKGPLSNPLEMTTETTPEAAYQTCVARLRAIPGYVQRFQRVFGTKAFTIDHVCLAIATFERTILSGNSPYDRWLAGDKSAMTQAQAHGQQVFKKAKCDACHSGFDFTDNAFANIGVGMDTADPDLGRYLITKRDSDRGAFKTPTLRDVEHTAPYMHNGSMKTLEAVVDHYDQGGTPNPWLDQRIVPLKLTAQEKADLVAFMKALSGEGWQQIQPPAAFPR